MMMFSRLFLGLLLIVVMPAFLQAQEVVLTEYGDLYTHRPDAKIVFFAANHAANGVLMDQGTVQAYGDFLSNQGLKANLFGHVLEARGPNNLVEANKTYKMTDRSRSMVSRNNPLRSVLLHSSHYVNSDTRSIDQIKQQITALNENLKTVATCIDKTQDDAFAMFNNNIEQVWQDVRNDSCFDKIDQEALIQISEPNKTLEDKLQNNADCLLEKLNDNQASNVAKVVVITGGAHVYRLFTKLHDYPEYGFFFQSDHIYENYIVGQTSLQIDAYLDKP